MNANLSYSEKEKYVLEKLTWLANLEGSIAHLRATAEDDAKQATEREAAALARLAKVREDIDRLIAEKTRGFPWLAEAIADYFDMKADRLADYLENKPHPATASAEVVRKEAKKRRAAERESRAAKYVLAYYEALFPWLEDFRDESADELIEHVVGDELDADPDPARKWLSDAEYTRLSTAERNQRALDRYMSGKKSKWHIGRDYERYVGYLRESEGYAVHYQGIVEGFEDLGRDLIATKGDQTEIIQCKCWRSERTVHEKHVFQLFGTTIEYILRRGAHAPRQALLFPRLLEEHRVVATLVTSTTVSDTAREFAAALGVRIQQQFPLQPYPVIKCNVSRRSNEKIYHLPFDQQYDRTLIEDERNERYVATVEEAEGLGFRRAWRWLGSHGAGAKPGTLPGIRPA